MWYTLIRHSEHKEDQTGIDTPIASEIPVLHALHGYMLKDKKISKIETSCRPDVPLMAIHFMAGVPEHLRPDDLDSSVYGVNLNEFLSSRISKNPDLKKKLKAEYKGSDEQKAGLTVEEYVLLEKTGLWDEITIWAHEIMSHIVELERDQFGNDDHVVGFSHGGILEPVYAIAKAMRAGGVLSDFEFKGLQATGLEKSFERCSAFAVRVEGGKVRELKVISRPNVVTETIVK